MINQLGLLPLPFDTTGRPWPNVTWFLDNTIIDESFERRSDGVTVNHLSFPNVGRQHLNARLVCLASNTHLTPPNSRVLILDIYCELFRHSFANGQSAT